MNGPDKEFLHSVEPLSTKNEFAKNNLLLELHRETSWLLNRKKERNPESWICVPSAVYFYGAVQIDRNAFEIQKEKRKATHCTAGKGATVCVRNTEGDSSETSAPVIRATYHYPLCAFGDHVDLRCFNPQLAVYAFQGEVVSETLENADCFSWLMNPFTGSSISTLVAASAQLSPSANNLFGMLGDSSPLSPDASPTVFTSRRPKQKFCRFGHTKTVNQLRPRGKNLRVSICGGKVVSAWDKEEPMSLPPLCSCTKSGTRKYWACVMEERCKGAVEASTMGPNPLVDKDVCGACSGLEYFPFSFLEIPLSHEISNAGDLVRKCPLPPQTDVFCETPKLTACIVARSAEHEWVCYKALYICRLHHNVLIFDCCSSFFYPCYSPSDRHTGVGNSPYIGDFMMASESGSDQFIPEQQLIPQPADASIRSPCPNSPSVTASPGSEVGNRDASQEFPSSSSQEGAATTYSSPLNPPCKYFANLVNASPLNYQSPLPDNFTGANYRRPYCLRRRTIPPFQHSSVISSEEIRVMVDEWWSMSGGEDVDKAQNAALDLKKELKKLQNRDTITSSVEKC